MKSPKKHLALFVGIMMILQVVLPIMAFADEAAFTVPENDVMSLENINPLPVNDTSIVSETPTQQSEENISLTSQDINLDEKT
ncbi:hypothetical protein [Microaceticoccus formicicus]|uniref:hypothetical protein n=1 Tax=Microaceticoccus formicicus TaxID=3118105 RepID=UPI003CD021A6|nr:hypothetical protein VZL98_02395 [Peptoniphilaceae bacterium AMB_02]